MNRPPFYIEAMDSAEEEALRREVVAWAHDPFLDGLMREFSFPDRVRAALAEMLTEAGVFSFAPPNFYDDRLGDTLDELDEPMGEVIRLLEDNLNAYRIWRELARSGANPAELDRELSELPDRLRKIGAAAKAAHRKRAQKSGPLAKIDLPELAERAARFYVTATGERFTQHHQNWAPGPGGVLGPTARGELFVFRVVEHVMPRRGRELQNLRKIKVDPPPR
jgi:hypothetical protein